MSTNKSNKTEKKSVELNEDELNDVSGGAGVVGTATRPGNQKKKGHATATDQYTGNLTTLPRDHRSGNPVRGKEK